MRFIIFFLALCTLIFPANGQSAVDGDSGVVLADSTSRKSGVVGTTILRIDLEQLPVRSIQQALGTVQGVEWREGTDDVYIHGQLSENLEYYWNGVPVHGTPHMAFDAIANIEVFPYHVPARFNGAAGVVNIETTQSEISGASFSVRGIASQRFDDTGFQQASVSGVVPFGKRGGFISGAFEATRSPLSSAIDLPSLRAESREWLENNPNQVLIGSGSGLRRAVDVPGSVGPGTSVDELGQALALSPDEFVLWFDRSVRFLTDDAFQYGAVSGYCDEKAQGSVSFELPVTGTLKIYGSASLQSGDETPYLPTYSLFNTGRGLQSDYQRSRVQVGGNISIKDVTVTVNGSTESKSQTTYNALFSSDIEDQFYYGFLDAMENSALRDSPLLRINGDVVELAPAPGVLSYYEVPVVGIAPVDYFRQEDARSNYVGVEGVYTRGVHRLAAGVQMERDVSRLWVQRQLATAFVHRVAFFGFQSYAEDAGFGTFGDVLFYGYDNLGLQATSSDHIPDSLSPGSLITTAPLITSTNSLYLTDQFKYRNVRIDAGIRVNRYANNQQALFDPFHLLPVQRVRDLDSEVPPEIGEDFAVYYSEPDEEIAGYRDRDGNYYYLNGERAEPHPFGVPPFGGHSGPLPTSTSLPDSADEVLTDSESHWTIEPRILATATVADNLDATVFYNRLSQSQGLYMAASLHQYDRAVTDGARIGNANLAPVVNNRYGFGLRYSGIDGATLSATAFEVRTSGIGVVIATSETEPRNYETYESSGRLALRGLALEVAGSLGEYVSASAGYTFQQDIELTDFPVSDHSLENPFEFGRISESANIPFRAHNLRLATVLSGPDNLFTRHGTIAVVLNRASGRHYSPRIVVDPYWQSIPGFIDIEGGVLSSTTNSINRIDLRAEKAFKIKNAVGLSFYLWVMNVTAASNEYSVYPTSGSVIDDGWLESAMGQDHLGLINAVYGPTARDAFSDQYGVALRDPSYVGIPRQVRFGVKMSF